MIIFVARTPTPPRTRTLEAAIFWGTLVVVAGLTKGFIAEAFMFPSSSMLPTLEVGAHVFASKRGTPGRGDVIVFDHPCGPAQYGKRIVALENDTVELRCNVLFINGKRVSTELVRANDSYADFHDYDQTSFRRNASRYRETLDGRTYEIFDRPDRPEQGVADQKDFPQDNAPDCHTHANTLMGGGPTKQKAGKIVDTRPPDVPCEPHRHFVVPSGHVFVLGDNRSNSNDSRYWGAVPVEGIRGRVIGIWLPLAHFGPID
ncbi:MAG: signal peptidase I [Myxococcota bacterium]|nr:signal peptidase I [Myxococcota bacterium]